MSNESDNGNSANESISETFNYKADELDRAEGRIHDLSNDLGTARDNYLRDVDKGLGHDPAKLSEIDSLSNASDIAQARHEQLQSYAEPVNQESLDALDRAELGGTDQGQSQGLGDD